MHTSTLIIGQGLCGTWLSYWLQQAGADFLTIDDAKPNSSTRVASGVINPVTGRRMAKTWLADELLPFAKKAYAQLGSVLKQELLKRCDILDFFAAPDRRLDFEKRALQFEEYLAWPTDEKAWQHTFNYPFGYGIVSPAWQADVQTMLSGWRQQLIHQHQLIEEQYDSTLLELLPNGIRYKNITADRIIFCDGVAAAKHHFFELLPFAFNKGEALIVDIPELSNEFIYKKTHTITPWQNGLFWVGSTYDRDYTNDQPTAIFRESTESWLRQFLKLPFTVVDHIAALRPTTIERRPFVGMHPVHTQTGIFNGMGTKGVSLAPWLGKQLAAHITSGVAILPDVAVGRHARLLMR